MFGAHAGLTFVAAVATMIAATMAGPATSAPWNGLYVGTPAGGGFSWTVFDAAAIAGDPAAVGGMPAAGLSLGILGGAQIGYGVQRGRVLYAVEGTLGGSLVQGVVDCGDALSRGLVCSTQLGAFATLVARVGFVRATSLVYVTSGLAWGWHSYEIREPSAEIASWGTARTSGPGWTIGLGNERELTDRFSTRAELMYVRFPTRVVTLVSQSYPDTEFSLAQSHLLATLSIVYGFGARDEERSEPIRQPRRDVVLGRRIWLPLGGYDLSLYSGSDSSTEIASQTFGGYTGVGGESFLFSTDERGLFNRFVAGVGVLRGGLLGSSHFAPPEGPDSATESMLEGGRFLYRINDYGYQLRAQPNRSLGVFAGYMWMLERYQAFGCTQLDVHPTTCVPTVPASLDYAMETALWAAVRIGVTGEFDLTDRLLVRGGAAFMPLAFHGATPKDWLRPDLGPLRRSGRGHGYEVDAAVTYSIGDWLSVGVGGRLWSLSADGTVAASGETQPYSGTSRHFNAFLEATIRPGE